MKMWIALLGLGLLPAQELPLAPLETRGSDGVSIGALLAAQQPTFLGGPSEVGRHGDGTLESSVRQQPPQKLDFPTKQSEIKCAVLSWDARLPKPALNLVCPPQQVFSPIHVYLRFTWRRLEDIPKNLSKIVAFTGSQTKIKPANDEVRVWLKVNGKGDENGHPKWVRFNQFDGIGLEGE